MQAMSPSVLSKGKGTLANILNPTLRAWTAAKFLVIGVLLVCSSGPVVALQPQRTQQPQQEQKPQKPPVRAEKCLACKQQNLITVPILIGIPTEEMLRQLEHGRALLGGCVGNPGKPQQAQVCLKCRKWKTKEMKHWQPLPKEFGNANRSTQAR